VALLRNHSEFPISVISMSARHDLALLLVLYAKNTPFLSLRDPHTLVPGERLFTIGASAGLDSTITDGVFTGFRKMRKSGEVVIQFSAPVNRGNSGGPLIDEKGEVVGVVSMKYSKMNGVPVSGVGFAVLSSQVIEEYRSYIEGQK